MSHCLVQIISSILFCWNIYYLQAVGQECEYRYVTQPPTEFRCNPYDTINQFILTCSVEGPASPGFSVAWFRRMNDRNTKELQTSQLGVAITLASSINAEASTVSYSSEITISGLDGTNNIGDYWCQVRLMNGTSFVEKSNILSLANERSYMEFSRCVGSQSINREDCLRMLNVTVPVVTDGNIQTNTESEVTTSFLSDLSLTTTESEVVTSFFSDLSLTNTESEVVTSDLSLTSTESEVVTSFFSDLSLTTQSTAGPVEKNINLPVIYVSVGCTMVILILLLSMCVAIIVFLHKCKLKTNTQEDSNGQPDEQATEGSPVNSNQNEGFDYNENIAYVKVCPVILNENISYAPTDSHTFAPLYEEIDDSSLSAWNGSMAYRQ